MTMTKTATFNAHFHPMPPSVLPYHWPYRRVVLLLGVLLLGVFLLVPSSPSRAAGDINHATYDDIIERGTLTVTVYEDFPPFSSSVNGKLVGVDIDIANAIAEKLGVKAVFRATAAGETVNDDLRNAIWKGHYLGGGVTDMMMHVPTETAFKRKNDLVFIMGDYYQEQLVLTRNIIKTGEFPTLAIFRHEKIGVELDSLPDFFLTGFGGGTLRENVVHYLTIPEAVAAMLNEEVSAVFAPRSQLESAFSAHTLSSEQKKRYETTHVVAPGLPKDRWSLGVAVSTHTRQLGYAIEDILMQMNADGEIAAIFDHHQLTYTAP